MRNLVSQVDRTNVKDRALKIGILAVRFLAILFLFGIPAPVSASSTSDPGLVEAASFDKDCSDYGTREAAGRDLEADPPYGRGDIFGLDADDDGVACEFLPRGLLWTAIPAGVGFLLLRRIDNSKSNLHVEFSDSLIEAWVVALLGMGSFVILVGQLPRATPVIVYSLIGVGVAVLARAFEVRTVSLREFITYPYRRWKEDRATLQRSREPLATSHEVELVPIKLPKKNSVPAGKRKQTLPSKKTSSPSAKKKSG